MNKSLKRNTKVRPRRRCKLVALFLLLTSSVTASTTDLVWDKTPIPLDLEVGEERIVHFADSMSVGLPANLRSIVRVQSIGNSVYLLATEKFERQRVLMRSTTDGSIVVFDLAADLEPATYPRMSTYVRLRVRRTVEQKAEASTMRFSHALRLNSPTHRQGSFRCLRVYFPCPFQSRQEVWCVV